MHAGAFPAPGLCDQAYKGKEGGNAVNERTPDQGGSLGSSCTRSAIKNHARAAAPCSRTPR